MQRRPMKPQECKAMLKFIRKLLRDEAGPTLRGRHARMGRIPSASRCLAGTGLESF